MALVEKASILIALTSTAGFCLYSMMKPRFSKAFNGEEIVEKRKFILSHHDIRVLYSSMSFLYLQSYKNEPKSLFLLKDVLDVAVREFCFV